MACHWLAHMICMSMILLSLHLALTYKALFHIPVLGLPFQKKMHIISTWWWEWIRSNSNDGGVRLWPFCSILVQAESADDIFLVRWKHQMVFNSQQCDILNRINDLYIPVWIYVFMYSRYHMQCSMRMEEDGAFLMHGQTLRLWRNENYEWQQNDVERAHSSVNTLIGRKCVLIQGILPMIGEIITFLDELIDMITLIRCVNQIHDGCHGNQLNGWDVILNVLVGYLSCPSPLLVWTLLVWMPLSLPSPWSPGIVP